MSDQSQANSKGMKSAVRVGVFGGTGFVGTSIVKLLVSKGYSVTSFSRSGEIPSHLKKVTWATSNAVKWEKADASSATSLQQKRVMSELDAVIIAVGSPPMPTFTEEQYAKKVRENGDTCVNVITAAKSEGVKRIVLIGATMPRWAPKAYLEGKNNAKKAAIKFVDIKKGDGAVVLFPGPIYGTKYLPNGIPIPLTPVMWPMSLGLNAMRRIGVTGLMERNFGAVFEGALEPMVSVDQVAKVAVDAATDQTDKYKGRITEFTNQQIIDFK